MTTRSGQTSSDFTFQTSDQARATQPSPLQPYGRFHADRHSSSGTTSASDLPAQVHDTSLRFPQQVGPDQYSAFSYPDPGAPAPMAMAWEWPTTVDFSEFTNHYEPQGELTQEIQNNTIATNDFSIPLPVTAAEPAFPPPPLPPQHSSHSSNPTPTTAQFPLSPPPRPPKRRPSVSTGIKRKVDSSEPNSAVSNGASMTVDNPPKRPNNKSRRSSETSITSPVVPVPSETRQLPTMTQTSSTAVEQNSQSQSQSGSEVARRKEQSKGTGPQGRVIDVSKPRKVVESTNAPDMLPAGKVFPIQIGSELFRLSGASISSDAPSYFSHFFIDQLHNNGGRASDVRTLYIDRDPETFREIALHLQGYHITPRDGEHFVKLFADAQFYSLPRLTKQLFSTDIFIRIGGVPFQIPRELFSSSGDSPNYFSLGFAQFFSTPGDSFPGLDRNSLLRPPSISPPIVASRDAETFGELIKILQGYNVKIRDDEHRSRLLRDARYFHLKGLEQRLISCEISYNLKRQRSEILIRLEDIRQSGISFMPDKVASDSDSGSVNQSMGVSPGSMPQSTGASPAPSITGGNSVPSAGYVSYARPYTDDHANTNILILETSNSESTTLFLPTFAPKASSLEPLGLNLRATFHNTTLARITSLFSVIASKMGLPATQPLGLMYLQTGSGVAAQPLSPANSGVSERRVRIRFDTDCAFEIDGQPAELRTDNETGRIGIRRIRTEQITSSSIHDSPWIWGGSMLDPEHGRLRADDDEPEIEWTLKRAHWRVRVEPVEGDGDARKMQVVLCGVKVEAFTVERSRNVQRGFLGG